MGGAAASSAPPTSHRPGPDGGRSPHAFLRPDGTVGVGPNTSSCRAQSRAPITGWRTAPRRSPPSRYAPHMAALNAVVALVTGARCGTGRGIALELGNACAAVYVTGRRVGGGPATDNLPARSVCAKSESGLMRLRDRQIRSRKERIQVSRHLNGVVRIHSGGPKKSEYCQKGSEDIDALFRAGDGTMTPG